MDVIECRFHFQCSILCTAPAASDGTNRGQNLLCDSTASSCGLTDGNADSESGRARTYKSTTGTDVRAPTSSRLAAHLHIDAEELHLLDRLLCDVLAKAQVERAQQGAGARQLEKRRVRYQMAASAKVEREELGAMGRDCAEPYLGHVAAAANVERG
mmetsp:Transcript_13107/g.26348  ORF Transcript_13107/g.26348 Transcript_13107/m.26348 type:complete len:157 (-) Transcript_13107:471-941(-)